MDFFAQIFNNKILWISIFACFLAQFIKIFTGKEKELIFLESQCLEVCQVLIVPL